MPEAGDAQRIGVLDGHLRLLGKTLTQAIDDLQHGDLKQFAESAKRVVEAYGQVADLVGDAAEATGDASTRVALARKSLQGLTTTATHDPQRRRALSDSIGQLRAMSMKKLREARDRYDQTDDPKERQKLLKNIDGLVRRDSQLNQLQHSLVKGSQPLLPGLSSQQVARQLSDFETALNEETEALELVSESTRLLVESTSHDMRHTFHLLEIESQLPAEQMRQLAEMQQTIEGTLEDLTQVHELAARSALELLSGSTEYHPPEDPQELLRRADELLGRSAQEPLMDEEQ
ncbi:MAG: hypothetical protein WD049_07895 [Candidatus Paceibacterota bacterium]